MKLYEYSASELIDMLNAGKCSSAEILGDITERISTAEKDIGAYITLNSTAKEAAVRSDELRSRGEPCHILSGIPVAVKDNISTAGMLTTCGSKMLENYIPPYDAHVIRCIKKAGMVITGKTNMDEFAMGSSTETSYFHVTRNPLDTSFSAGGSSGGSAAAIASGECISAICSDTGGSVRMPASFCGLVGLKPTFGNISRCGLIAFSPSIEQIGVMGKTVRDTELLYSLVSEYDPMDVMMTNKQYHSFDVNELKGLRIGIPTELFGDNISDECKKAVADALRLLEQNGAVITEISIPMLKYAANIYYIISSAEASSELARYDGVRFGHRSDSFTGLDDMYIRSRTEGFGDEVKRRIMLGTFVLSEGSRESYYLRAVSAMHMLKKEIISSFEHCDLIASPSYPEPPFHLAESISNTARYSADICTVPANLSGLPAISIPCGKAGNDMPLGLQLMSMPFREDLLFFAAGEYEKLCGGFSQFRGGKAYGV